MTTPLPSLGFGLGLRVPHYDYVIEHQPAVDWFEIISENFMVPGGKPLWTLDKIRENYPIVMHGVSLSIGSTDPLNQDYLKQLKQLADRAQPAWFSDHLCWTGVQGKNTHDLMPLPYTEEAIAHIVERIARVQDYMGRQMLIENVSSYVTYTHSAMTEWAFLTEIAARADCLLLLDINNIYVSSFNHHFNPKEYLYNVPKDRVQQFHLAGHSNMGTHLIDTHDHPVVDSVWDLYRLAVAHFGEVSTMIERDDDIPEFSVLYEELMKAKDLACQTT